MKKNMSLLPVLAQVLARRLHLRVTRGDTMLLRWEEMKKNSQNFIQNQAKQLAEYKQILESEHELLLHKNRDTEKSLIDLQQKVLFLTTSLDQEKANRQKLQVELALANERLTKEAEELVIHKNQYEGRLKMLMKIKTRL